jgi:hypothetical protein
MKPLIKTRAEVFGHLIRASMEYVQQAKLRAVTFETDGGRAAARRTAAFWLRYARSIRTMEKGGLGAV